MFSLQIPIPTLLLKIGPDSDFGSTVLLIMTAHFNPSQCQLADTYGTSMHVRLPQVQAKAVFRLRRTENTQVVYNSLEVYIDRLISAYAKLPSLPKKKSQLE